MSDTEQQFTETSQNGHEEEEEEDCNAAGHSEEGNVGQAVSGCEGAGPGGTDAHSQSGASNGAQINAGKCEEVAGYVTVHRACVNGSWPLLAPQATLRGMGVLAGCKKNQNKHRLILWHF